MTAVQTKTEVRRRQMIEAAIESLTEVGYAGTSIREIARRGHFNSALISYYFGGLHGLLLAALDHSSAIRMARYREALEGVGSLDRLADVGRQIYQEDLEGGHITVFTELVAASLAHPELGAELVARAEPWIDFVEEAIRQVAGDSPLLQLVPPEQIAYAVICFYLGVNLMTQLESDHQRVTELFATAQRLAPIASELLRGSKLRG